MRSRNVRNVGAIRFGAQGLTDVAICDVDKLPVEVRGGFTGKLYVWTVQRATWPLWVDVRDLPTVIKRLEKEHGIGLDDLAGKKIDQRKAELAQKQKDEAKAAKSKTKAKTAKDEKPQAEESEPPELDQNTEVTEV